MYINSREDESNELLSIEVKVKEFEDVMRSLKYLMNVTGSWAIEREDVEHVMKVDGFIQALKKDWR